MSAQAASEKKILVIEDEAGIRNNILLMLKIERFGAVGAENGRVGLELARHHQPDLILCDVNMPEVDGFAVLEALRAEPRFADTPFVFLTALDDRASQRRGMNLGADDYLTKPFTRDELMAAVSARLRKHESSTQALAARLLTKAASLREKFRDRVVGEDAWGPLLDVDPAETTGKIGDATILFSDIRNFTTFSERLTAAEIAEFLNAYLQQACAPVLASGGRIMKFLGDGVMALFEPVAGDTNDSHAKRALRASLAMQLASRAFRDWIHARHPSRGLPDFSIGVGLHSGEVLLCVVGTAGQGEFTVIGDTVNVASRLEGQTKELGWAIVASDTTIASAGAGVTVGGRQSVQLRGRSAPTLVHEVIGADAQAASDAAVELPAEMREVMAANAQLAADAAKAALGITLREIATAAAGKTVSVRGYKVLSRIGQGGSSTVYRAERESDGQEVVLKILNLAVGSYEALLQRFIQEFDIISAIDHPNVVKIHDRGFSEDLAYIAMEYFPGGTLADIILGGLTARQGLSLLAQAAAGLREIHNHGIIHRDVKPANLMARADGTIALVDFGIAKRLGTDLGGTLHGEVFGTPYYISPEQTQARAATARSDLYSLGVIFYEMLMRRRPFEAESVAEVLALHAKAPRPRLPQHLAPYQALLDGMLAVDAAQRFASADALLHSIDDVWTRQAVRALQSGA
jgi:serine/threonine-protein kinase PpkA